MTKEEIVGRLGATWDGLPEDVASGKAVYRGKVRDVVDLGDRLLIIASDRISAFDRVLSTIPFKGEVLNRIARFWFEKTVDIVGNHIITDAQLGHPLSSSTGRAVLVKKAQMLPVEVVVRGYLTGSAWRDYEAGKPISGITLPARMSKDQAFGEALITPTTKESVGHDKPISCAEIVSSGLVEEGLWKEVEKAALALFARGQRIAGENGLILVDTKYEFGLVDGKLTICDEIHTPDSSRYWYAEGYAERFSRGEKQRELDKEHFRRWLMERGYMGDGQPPAITEDIRTEVAQKYIEAFETVTGESFSPRASAEAERDFLTTLLRKA